MIALKLKMNEYEKIIGKSHFIMTPATPCYHLINIFIFVQASIIPLYMDMKYYDHKHVKYFIWHITNFYVLLTYWNGREYFCILNAYLNSTRVHKQPTTNTSSHNEPQNT